MLISVINSETPMESMVILPEEAEEAFERVQVALQVVLAEAVQV